jgi:hypothetical protein
VKPATGGGPHPDWCSPGLCRTGVGGSHRSEPVQTTEGETRVTAWLQQRHDDQALLGWTAAYRTIGGAVAFLPLPKAALLLDAISRLVEHGERGSA